MKLIQSPDGDDENHDTGERMRVDDGSWYIFFLWDACGRMPVDGVVILLQRK